jgi:hypothetical protein
MQTAQRVVHVGDQLGQVGDAQRVVANIRADDIGTEVDEIVARSGAAPALMFSSVISGPLVLEVREKGCGVLSLDCIVYGDFVTACNSPNLGNFE